MKHKTVRTYDPFSKTMIDLDVDIRELILRLWNKGIRTFHSCQGNRYFLIQDLYEFPNSEPLSNMAYITMEGDARTLLLTNSVMSSLMVDPNKTFHVELNAFPDPQMRGMYRIVWRFLHSDIRRIRMFI